MPIDKNLPWLLIHGTADEVIDFDIVKTWLDNLSVKPQVEIFDEASHFFHGRLVELKNIIINFTKKL